MASYVTVLAAVLVLPAADSRPTVQASPAGIVISQCLISLAEEAQVPAKEAGQLTDIAVVAGQQVVEGQQLAQIDDARPRMEHEAALRRLEAATEESTNQITVIYSKATARVAEAELAQFQEANAKVSGTITPMEIRRAELKLEESRLSIQQSEFKLRVAALEAKIREAELRAAAQNIENRRVLAPLAGVVTELRRHKGEWVQPGDTVLHIVRMDRLWIEGFLNAAEYSPSQIDERPVSVRVVLAQGREEVFRGKIIFVSPLVETTGEFRIRAEVLNRQENEHWLLRSGLVAELTIHLR